MKLLLLSLMMVISACVPKQESKVIERSGFDLSGEERSCNAAPKNEACTAIFGPDEQFAEDCRASGHEVIQCGCHDYLCTGPIEKTGRDINGEERTCKPQYDLTCTQEFTPNDQFAQDCEANGLEAVACGCHDFICADKE